jgi:hypothetical protein
MVAADKRIECKWTVEQKAQIVVEGCKLSGLQLTAYLDQQGIRLAHFERWRIALAEDGQSSVASRAIIKTRTTIPTSRSGAHPAGYCGGTIVWRPLGAGLSARWDLSSHS